ncbi:hypothetical protein CHUAL_001034 [Chamberlinius hualienensis]
MLSLPLWLSIFIGFLQLANSQFALRSNGMRSMVTNGETGHIYAQMAPIVPEVVMAEEPLLVTVENGNGGEAVVETVEPVAPNGNGGSRFFFRSNGNGGVYAAAAPAPAAEITASQPASTGYETAANGARFFGFFRTNGNGKGNYAVNVAPVEPTPAPATEAITNGYTAVSSGGRIVGFLRNSGKSNGGYSTTAAPVVEELATTQEPTSNVTSGGYIPETAAVEATPVTEAVTNGYSVVSNGARFSAFFRNGPAANGNGAVMAVNGNGAYSSAVETTPSPAITSNSYNGASNGARLNHFLRTNGNGGYNSAAAASATETTSSGARFNGILKTNGNGGYTTPAVQEKPATESISSVYAAIGNNGARFNGFLRTNGNGLYASAAPQVESLPAVAVTSPEVVSNGYVTVAAATNGARFNKVLRTNGNGGYSSPVAQVQPDPVPDVISNGYSAVADTNGARFNMLLRTNTNGGNGATAEVAAVSPVTAPVTNGYSNGHSTEEVMPALAPAEFLPAELAEGVAIPQIPGVAGVDYPIFSQAIISTFNCQDKLTPGYYADIETKCQVFRICEPLVDHFAFLCPNGTMFNEKHSVCDWWYNVNCQANPQPAPLVSSYLPDPTPAPVVQTYTPPPPPPTPAPIVEAYTLPPPPPTTPAPIVHIYASPVTLPPPPPTYLENYYAAVPVSTEEVAVVPEATNGELVPVEEVVTPTNGNGEALRVFGNVRIHPVQPSIAVPFRFSGLRNNNGYLEPIAVVEEVIPEVTPVTNGGYHVDQTDAPASNGKNNKGRKGLRANGGRKPKNNLRNNRVKGHGLRNENGAVAQNGYQLPQPAAVNGNLAVTNGNGASMYYGQAPTVVVTNGDAGVAINGNGVVAVNGDSGVAVNGNGRFNSNQHGAFFPMNQILRSGNLRNNAAANQYGNGQVMTAVDPVPEEPVGISY